MFHQAKYSVLFLKKSCCSLLDFCLGVFIETLENEEIRIERYLFASQEYTELLIAYVVLTRLESHGLNFRFV